MVMFSVYSPKSLLEESNMRLYIRKFVFFIAVISLLFVLPGCQSKDYDKAVAEFNAGNYDAAEELFVQLGDYEDSADYLNKMGWCRFYDYVKDNGTLIADCTDSSTGSPVQYTVTISVNGESLDATMKIDLGTVSEKFFTTLSLGSNTAPLTASSSMHIMSGAIDDDASADWDISSYAKGSGITWDSYNVSGHRIDGSPLLADTEGIIASSTSACNTALTRFTTGIEKAILDSGLDVTMDDLGFTSWNS